MFDVLKSSQNYGKSCKTESKVVKHGKKFFLNKYSTVDRKVQHWSKCVYFFFKVKYDENLGQSIQYFNKMFSIPAHNALQKCTK